MLFSAVKPMNAALGQEPFDDDRYMFEPKWDGSRILIHKQGSRIEAYTRSGRVVTGKFPELQEGLAAIRAHSAILDCEGIVLRGGKPVFDDFMYRDRISQSAKISGAVLSHPATFVAFDILQTDRELLKEPLTERKKVLHGILAANSVILPTLYVEGQGKALFDLMKAKHMEGIVAKRKDSLYRLDTRSADWQKLKYAKSIDVMVLGYRLIPFALNIGLNFRTVKNKPVGMVEAGLTEEDKKLFLALAEPLHTVLEKGTQWIEPRLVCRIDYLERSDTHQLSATVFRCFLPEKASEDCVWGYD
ncbi:DNA ligase [Paenibacillus sp. GCM10023248]|uniref:ATP-dependent DNA ligase n=1 Tax=Bacillales TaxID=1385 RepID=UPI002378DC4C|nr:MULTISPECIES: DNA ligase [Bacillales]MDD9265618.1 DNA ligase [Paenibacillus sp. MAHUQ-63]MDR6878858.1 bifunctional non-homologous end joining protein LigD [Bacillus sp. 3255]